MAVTITDASLQGIYNRLHAIPEYHPLDAQTFADWSVEAGDVVTVSRENDSYSSPVHSSRMVWKGSPETQLTSGGNKQRDSVSTVSQKKYRRGSAAQRSQEIIQSTLEDEVGGVRSIVTQMANQWSVVVEGTGDNAHIKPAVIQASIDSAGTGGTSKILLSADNIVLDGDAVADAIQSQNVQVQQLTVTGELIVDDLGSITAPAIECYFAEFSELYVGEESYNKLNIYDISISGNTLTVWYVDGSHQDFSKAVSLDGRWNSAYNVRAGKTYTVTATMNGSSVGGEGVELADGDAVSSISSSVAGSWNGNVYTGKIAKLLDDGTYDATGLIYQVDVTDKLQSKTVTPTSTQQTITPDEGKIGLSEVIVEAGGGGSAGTITGISCSNGAVPDSQERRTGKVKAVGTDITNSPYEVDFSMNYESFRPESTSVDTAAVYFMLDGVKIGRFADSNLVAGNIKGGVTIMGIEGTYSSHASIDRMYSEPGTIDGETTEQRSTVIRAEGTNVATLEKTHTLSCKGVSGDFYVELNGYKKVGSGASTTTASSVVARLKAPIDIHMFDYKSDSEPEGAAWNPLPTKTGVDKPLVIDKKEAWYELAINVGDNNAQARKWYKVKIEIDGKDKLVSSNIKDGKKICGVTGNFSGFTTNKTVTRVFCDVTSSGMKKSGKLYRYNENTKSYVAVVNSDKYWFYCSDTLDTSTNGGTRKVYYDA